MQTGTISEIDLNIGKNNKYIVTIILLCIGYFIDFYDLTTFSSSYSRIIQDSFHIYDTLQIQQLFLKITSIYTNTGKIIIISVRIHASQTKHPAYQSNRCR